MSLCRNWTGQTSISCSALLDDEDKALLTSLVCFGQGIMSTSEDKLVLDALSFYCYAFLVTSGYVVLLLLVSFVSFDADMILATRNGT